MSGRRINSNICKRIVDAIDKEDVNAYRIAFGELKAIYEKSTVKRQREEYINRISFVAPEWAEAISKRSGVHGADSVPENIIEAWKWKQFDSIIKDIISEPYTELQKIVCIIVNVIVMLQQLLRRNVHGITCLKKLKMILI